MKKRVADIIIDTLADNGITNAFCVVGGGAMYLDNALGTSKRIKTIFNHHEQACAMAAEGYAKYTQNKPALVCVTSGPGGTNTLTGIMGAYQDSVPIIVISGQVRYDTTVAQSGLNLRRRGEQEFDITNSIKNMTKYCKMVIDPLSIKQEVQKAYDIAMSGRRGPVWLDIPLNVQSATVEEDELYPVNSKIEYITPPKQNFNEVIELLKSAKRPCILAGSAIRSAGVHDEFMEFLNCVKIPVVSAICQSDVISTENELCGGTSGTLSSRSGNFILQNSDVILVLGCSLGFKQTGFAQENFAPQAKIIMVDINPDEAKKEGLNIYKFLHSDLKTFFDLSKNIRITASVDWLNYSKNVTARFSPFGEAECENANARVNASEFWKKFLSSSKAPDIIAVGNSSSGAGLLQYSTQHSNQRVLVNFNCGSMGDDLPLALGAAVAANKEVYLSTGEGSFMMNLQELATIKHNNIPVKMIVFLNEGYGNIKQTCKNYFNGQNIGCGPDSLGFPNFEKLAQAFEIPHKKCSKTSEIEESIEWASKQNGFCLVEILQKLDNPPRPRLMSKYNEDGTFEKPRLEDMFPFLDKDEMDKLMISKKEEIKC